MKLVLVNKSYRHRKEKEFEDLCYYMTQVDMEKNEKKRHEMLVKWRSSIYPKVKTLYAEITKDYNNSITALKKIKQNLKSNPLKKDPYFAIQISNMITITDDFIDSIKASLDFDKMDYDEAVDLDDMYY